MKTQEMILQIDRHRMIRMYITAIAMTAGIFFFSVKAFAQSTVVDIVVNSEDHTTLEAAVIAAELADDLIEIKL